MINIELTSHAASADTSTRNTRLQYNPITYMATTDTVILNILRKMEGRSRPNTGIYSTLNSSVACATMLFVTSKSVRVGLTIKSTLANKPTSVETTPNQKT